MATIDFDMQHFLDNCFAILKGFPDATQFVHLFFGIDILHSIENTGMLPRMAQHSNYEALLAILCMTVSKKLFLGDLYYLGRLPLLPAEYPEFEQEFIWQVLSAMGSCLPSAKSRVLEAIINRIGDDPSVLNEAKSLALRFAKKAKNIENLDAFAAAICRLVVYDYM